MDNNYNGQYSNYNNATNTYNGYQQGVNNNYGQGMMYGQQQMNNNQNMVYGQPNFNFQKKDNSGIKFLIIFVIVIAALVVGIYYIYPTINKSKLIGSWSCTDGQTNLDFTFEKNGNFKVVEPITNVSISGTYKTKKYGKPKDSSYGREGFNYLELNVITKKISSYGAEQENPDAKEVRWLFGFKDNEGNIVVSESNKSGLICTKK